MINQKIILCQGLPASGKSTWAIQHCTDNPEFVRVNRDDIRAFFGDLKWSGKFEKDVIDIQRLIANTALRQGKSVIVDDTNFNSRVKEYWKELAKCYDIEFEIEVFDTPVEVCIERDLKREKPVGMHVILNMYNTYLNKEKLLDGDKK